MEQFFFFPSIRRFLLTSGNLSMEDVTNIDKFANDFILYHKTRTTEGTVYIPEWEAAILNKFLRLAVKDPDSAIKITREVSYREPENINAMIDAMEAII